MGMDEIAKYAGKRFFDPKGVLKGSSRKLNFETKEKKRLPGLKSPLRSPSGAAHHDGPCGERVASSAQGREGKQAQERKMMAMADAEGRSFNLQIMEQDRLIDEQKFVYYAGKFGPLDGIDLHIFNKAR